LQAQLNTRGHNRPKARFPLTGDRFPLPVNTGRAPCWRARPSTRRTARVDG